MSTAANRVKSDDLEVVEQLLANGDCMSQAEFHHRYHLYPDSTKFELIGGTVYMASPLRRPHAKFHGTLSMILRLYAAQTPGVEMLDNATTILGDQSEPQPDLCLRVLSAFGGQSRETEAGYLEGAPELIAEVCHSTRAMDLHQKRHDYESAGVLEYLVLSLEEPKVFWFDFATKQPIETDRRQIARSQKFPGLWIHVQALLEEKDDLLLATSARGLKSPAHRAFVKQLLRRRDELRPK
jgi:hypothetical protein